MRIERIEKSKHKQERVLVFLEGGDLLRITGVELLRFGLHKDMELPEELVEELRRSAERSETKARAARLASSRMLSKKELSDRLVKKGTERGEAEELADWLEDLGHATNSKVRRIVEYRDAEHALRTNTCLASRIIHGIHDVAIVDIVHQLNDRHACAIIFRLFSGSAEMRQHDRMLHSHDFRRCKVGHIAAYLAR